MKFKTKEEIIGNREVYRTPINEAFESFAERVEFYKEYKGEQGLVKLEKEEKEALEDWIKFANQHSPKLFWKDADMTRYKMWLFDHCFKDVIKNVR